eukprot:GHVQ01000595.1.p1 GENE.GHVQ01000595.1~~GHVQ01000595.1.p1  ORF type:complete len:185 (-),score=13.50 GHVQ01000595.1:541-1095(-)
MQTSTICTSTMPTDRNAHACTHNHTPIYIDTCIQTPTDTHITYCLSASMCPGLCSCLWSSSPGVLSYTRKYVCYYYTTNCCTCSTMCTVLVLLCAECLFYYVLRIICMCLFYYVFVSNKCCMLLHHQLLCLFYYVLRVMCMRFFYYALYVLVLLCAACNLYVLFLLCAVLETNNSHTYWNNHSF